MIENMKNFIAGILCLASIESGNCATDESLYDGPKSDFIQMSGETEQSRTELAYDIHLIGGRTITTQNIMSIVEPTYDQTFKALFTGEAKIESFSGKERLISLLNSLYYPEADDLPDAFKIRRITPLNNEITQIGIQDGSDSLRFDIAFTCEAWNENVVGEAVSGSTESSSVDVEMQRAYEPNFAGRLYGYASAMHRKYQKSVKVLAFLNHDGCGFNSSSFRIKPCYIDHVNGQVTGILEGVTDISAIDLGVVANLISAGKNVVINGKQIQKTGLEWLKLLSIRQWQSSQGKHIVTFDGVAPEVKSAMVVLSKCTEQQLIDIENSNKAKIGMIQGAKLEGKLEVARSMLEANVGIDFVQQCTKLSTEEIKRLCQQLLH